MILDTDKAEVKGKKIVAVPIFSFFNKIPGVSSGTRYY